MIEKGKRHKFVNHPHISGNGDHMISAIGAVYRT